jgi:hypothetical protein
LIVASSLANSSARNSITTRRGASAASFIERIIGSWWKLVFSAKAAYDLAIRTRAEDLAGHISADGRNPAKTRCIVRERPRIRQYRLGVPDGLLDAVARIVRAKPSHERGHASSILTSRNNYTAPTDTTGKLDA